jgi:outer membrane protein insertion porin family
MGTPWYVEEDVQEDAEHIADRLRRKGRADVRAWAEPVFSPDRSEVEITFRVTEGERIGISEVHLLGNLAIDDGALMEALDFRPGEPYHARRLPEMRAVVQEMYAEEGFVQTALESRVEIDRAAGAAVITIAVEEGPRSRVRRIRFEGHAITSDSLLQAQLTFREGEVFRRARVRSTTDNLYRQGIFRWVRSDVEVISDEEVDVLFTLKERKPGLLKIGGGYGSFEGIRGALGVSYDNLFGRAKRGEVEYRASRVGYRGDIRYVDPRIFQSRLRGRLELYLEDRHDPVFQIKRNGGAATITHPLVEKVEFSLRSRRELSEVADLASGLTSPDKSLDLRSIAFILHRDGRDAPLCPVRGTLSRIALESAGGVLGGEAHFEKVTAFLSAFAPIDPDHLVLALAARAGWIFPRRSREFVHIQEQFFTGGEGTVRGFREREIYPVDSNGLPVGSGGNSLLVLNAELRCRIWGVLWGGTFWDAGAVWDEEGGIDLEDLRHSPGVGLRYLTPVGPIRLDWGYKLSREPWERPWELHLSVGFAF